MPTPPLPPASRPPLQTADGRPVDIQISEESGRSLTDVLKAGDVVTGRVVERFAGDTYLFAVRGRQLFAASRAPLDRDSVARFQVLRSGNELALRLLNTSKQDSVSQTGVADRLQQLHLPTTATAEQVLSSFEARQAPLQANRLQTAIAQANQSPPAERPAVINAHAELARLQLPATPLLLDLAREAGRSGLPDPAGFLKNLQPQLQHVLAQGQAANTAQQSTPAALTQSTTAAAGPTVLPPVVAETAAAQTATTPGTSPANQLPVANQTGATLPQTLAPTLQATAQQLAMQLDQLLEDLPGDAATDTRRLIEQLRANNIRAASDQAPTAVASEQEQDEPNLRPMLTHLVELAQQLDRSDPLTRQLTELMQTGLREHLGDSLFQPSNLRDYDMVLPLVLPPQQGQNVPGRLAVRRQRQRNGDEAIFIRVDTELQRLGPLSIRLGSLADSGLNLVLLATGRSIDALQQEAEDLQNDLAGLGMEARIRVGDLLQEGSEP